MADPQPQDTGAQPSPDIGAIIGGDRSAVSDLIGVQRAKTAADESIISGAERQQAADARRVEAAYKAEGIGHDELKPWDAEKEHRKFERDPIEGFGSVGGLFAMVASAFTKAPMENAINGMAGAINSIKAGDEAAYERAHQSWKDNTKLVLDRHKAQHELYQDALGLMSTNQQIAQIKLNHAAVKFGDQKMLALAEHGMIKEMFELQEARARSATIMQETMERTTERTLRDKAYEAGIKDMQPTGNPQVDAAHKLALYTRTHGLQKETPQQALMGQFFLENPNATAEEAAQFADKHGIIRQYGGAGGAGAKNIPGRVETEMVLKRAEELRKEDLELTETEAYTIAKREIKVQGTPPSANKIDELRGKIDQTDNIITGSEKQLEFLKNYKGGAGLMGKIMRGEEIASNIVGAGTQSDRVAFRRRVLELQEIVPRILTDSSGRPLASAQKKVDSIVAGLEAGDTTANTVRAYKDLIEEIKKRQKDYRGRLEGGYESGSKSSGQPIIDESDKKSDTNKNAPWLKDPVKGGEKRSDVEPEVQVG